MTASQIMTESMVDESITAVKSTTPTDLSDDDHQENTTNGHTDLQYVYKNKTVFYSGFFLGAGKDLFSEEQKS